MTLIISALVFCLLCYYILSRFAVRRWLPIPAKHDSSSPGSATPQISKDPAFIRPDYDVVVIGSGYGGGVAASRFARAGKRVCVLEKGAESWAGQFPHTLKTALPEYRINDFRPGRKLGLGRVAGLYQTHKGEGQDVFSGCGLGGTSLINAGVFLRADSRIFSGSEWPIEFRGRSHDMAQYYEKGERMFQPTPYPESLPKPQKLSIFEQQWKEIAPDHCLSRTPLTISFEDCTNSAGVALRQSTGSGNECTGLNDGSKNSVLVTYLADAWNWGTELFCGVQVERICRLESNVGYLIYYSLPESHQESGRKMWIRARELVVLAAGALGTTEILLRSQSYGLSTSPVLGQRLSGNGDLLGFSYDSNCSFNAVGRDTTPILRSKRCGPTITACVDMRGEREAPNVKDGFLLQDGAIPEALGPLTQAMIEAHNPAGCSRGRGVIRRFFVRIWTSIMGPYWIRGSVNRTGVYLVMSHDENKGTMTLSNGRPVLEWSGIGPGTRNRRINSLLARATAKIGGALVTAPSITVHPLGGCCMSSDSTGLGGVVNHKGQVFSGLGEETYEGIICVDASIIPGSLSVNPCATITALAERCCDLLARERGWVVDERSNERLDFKRQPYKPSPLPPHRIILQEQVQSNEKHGGLKFDEVLQGYLQIMNDDCSFENAAQIARDVDSSARASLTVGLYSTKQRSYKGYVTGTVSFGALSQDPLMITRGSIDFFTIDEKVSDAVNLIYDLHLVNAGGEEYTLHGFKTIDSSIAFSPARTWIATTTLNTTIYHKNGALLAKGILRLPLQNFASELQSLRCSSTVNSVQRTYTVGKFLNFFVRNVLSYVLSPLRPLQYALYKEMGSIAECDKEDTPIVLIPGASVDDQVFSLPTIPVNTIDYLTSHGYRCYVPVPRFGIGEEAKNGWTVYDARLDVKAALEYVRSQEANRKVYAIVHCLGSIATATALLTGDIKASWLSGMTCSQVFTDLIYSKDNNFKARHQSFIEAYNSVFGDWFSCRPSQSASSFQYLLDQLLRFYPMGSRKEICNSAACHRCDVPFGRCWSHANLNHETHARLNEFFDGIHVNFLKHLSRMGATPPHYIRNNLPEFADLVTTNNTQRLAGLKICFLSGSDNAVWKPDATKRSLDMLKQIFPDGEYERVVVQGYGHLDSWMGEHAKNDVYPRVMHHIRSCESAQEMCDDPLKWIEDNGFVNIVM